MTLGDDGLEMVQVESVGKSPVTWTEIHLPAITFGIERIRIMTTRTLNQFCKVDQFIFVWIRVILIMKFERTA